MFSGRIIGRDAELERLTADARDALAGRGTIRLVTGEVGVGKTRLLEEAEHEARELGFRCAWGRCWESGGAPALWPWVQALGSLRRAQGDVGPVDRYTKDVVDALLAPATATGPGEIQLAGSRFEVFEAVGDWLARSSIECPIWIALEDLHAADDASLLLLDALSSPIRAARVVVLASTRPSTGRTEGSARAWSELRRHARSLALSRLDPGASEAILRESSRSLPADVIDDAIRTTGGLPLFLVELCRLLDASPDETTVAGLVPASVQSALQAHLDGVDSATRAVLERIAVLGVDIDRDTAADAFGADVVDDALRAAARRGLVRAATPGRLRFVHTLLQETLSESLAPNTRADAHGRIAVALERRPDVPPSLLAHHRYAAGAGFVDGAVAAGLRAARAAIDAFAFEAAHEQLDRALLAVEGCDDARVVRAQIGILRGLAHIGEGHVDDGLAACVDAARAAEAAERPDMVAEAALAYGSILRFTRVDATLVTLLERALGGLPVDDSGLRARVMARLAAARQPCADPAGPIALALDAVAMAERLGDPHVELAALAAGGSALVDLAHPRQRLPLDRRELELAAATGRAPEALQAHIRLAFDLAELADFTGAEDHVVQARRLAVSDVAPRDRWRAPALGVLLDLWHGELDGAAERIDEAERIGRERGDPNAAMCALFQRARWSVLTGRSEHVATVEALLRPRPGAGQPDTCFHDAMRARFLLQIGRTRDGVEALTTESVRFLMPYGDRTTLLAVATWAAAAQDAEAGASVVRAIGDDAELFVTDGVLSLCWQSPVGLVLAFAHEAMADVDTATDLAARAAVATARTSGHATAAECAAHAARLAAVAGRFDDAERHRAMALRGIETHGLDGLRHILPPPGDHARARPRPHDIRESEAGGPTFTAEGDVWRVDYNGASARLKATKGIGVLAQLVAAPRTPFHVLDLVAGANPDANERVDRGEGGELLDRDARSAYRTRVQDLQEELAEAESYDDIGRVERIRSELEFITDELIRATGLGGRSRRAAGAAEKARQAIRKQVKTALSRIEAVHPELHHHLARSIRTGSTCTYDP